MAKNEPSSTPRKAKEPFLVINISRTTALLTVLSLALVAIVLGSMLSGQDKPHPAAPVASVPEETPTIRTITAAKSPAKPIPSSDSINAPEPEAPRDEPVKVAVVANNNHAEIRPTESHAVVYQPIPVRAEEPEEGPRPATAVVAVESVPVAVVTEETTLQGAGSTFAYPIFQRWFNDFHRIAPKVQFEYEARGSGAGIKEMTTGTGDFGATDMPMTDAQLAEAGKRIVQIPAVLGAVVPIYNLPDVTGEVKFTPQILAGIYQGTITSWSDPEIAKANPELRSPGVTGFPNIPIVVTHRFDGCRETAIFTEYLSSVSPAWRHDAGTGSSVKWPAGLGVKGNEGVRALVRQTEGAVGYVDFQFAESNQLRFGSVRNRSGKFVRATLENITAAAESYSTAADLREPIVNGPGIDAYPISGFTWMLVPAQEREPEKQRGMLAFLGWMLDDGQGSAEQLRYAPLPRKLALRMKQQIAQLQMVSEVR